MDVLLATNNPDKKSELEEILDPHSIIMPQDLEITFSFEETGDTYLDNALGKAKHLFEISRKVSNLPVLADDSGLSVKALDGAPGVYSSRYGSPEKGGELSSRERNRFLLNNMKGIEDRSAFFVCCLVLIYSEYRIFTVQETVEGEINHEPRGEGGFGYDPLFYMADEGKTTAELSPEKKHAVSHRGRAGRVILTILNSLKS
jgi:XTP/dITP diphosphohydrolase